MTLIGSIAKVWSRGLPVAVGIRGPLAAMLVPWLLGASPILADSELFREGFERAHWFSTWGLEVEPKNTRVVRDDSANDFESLDGGALQVRIPKGEHRGIGNLGLRAKSVLGSDPDELYLRYYLRFGSDWQPSANGKLPGFGGTYGAGGWGGKRSTGFNGWSARGYYRPLADGRIAIGSYVYHEDMEGNFGTAWLWTAAQAQGLERNRWYCIEQHLRLNRPGERDGLLEAWIDGLKVFTRTGIRFRDTASLGIEKIWMNVYHGGKDPAPRDLTLYLDDVVVATRYIGPKHESELLQAEAGRKERRIESSKIQGSGQNDFP